MITIRTPYRISFFGGGTDYYDWYKEYNGDILSTTINHYNYISCRYLSPFHSKLKDNFSWKILENNKKIGNIRYQIIKSALIHYNIKQKIEIINQYDLPVCSGLGSSSSFCAGLIKAIYAIKNKDISKNKLVKETIKFEREILKESGGIQDQIASIYGGLNYIHINKNGTFSVKPLNMKEEKKQLLNEHLLLFFTGITRNSTHFAKNQIKSIKNRYKILSKIQEMVKYAKQILVSDKKDLDDFGYMLDEYWKLKSSLTNKISNSLIDDIYNIAIKNGAIGGKILGAGGGGFILFYAKPNKHNGIKNALNKLINVPFKFDNTGCQTILYSPKEYYI